jgi:hypothetical protein
VDWDEVATGRLWSKGDRAVAKTKMGTRQRQGQAR